MIVDFDAIEISTIPHMRGGEKELLAAIHDDELNRIMRGRLVPGASIGMHTHDTGSEIIYILSGQGKALYDGGEERVGPGSCQYCPKGHAHSLVNDGGEDLIFFAVIPKQ